VTLDDIGADVEEKKKNVGMTTGLAVTLFIMVLVTGGIIGFIQWKRSKRPSMEMRF
jgi:hypothetical protein